MGPFTRDNTELAVDLDDLGTQNRAEGGGMITALDHAHVNLPRPAH